MSWAPSAWILTCRGASVCWSACCCWAYTAATSALLIAWSRAEASEDVGPVAAMSRNPISPGVCTEMRESAVCSLIPSPERLAASARTGAVLAKSAYVVARKGTSAEEVCPLDVDPAGHAELGIGLVHLRFQGKRDQDHERDEHGTCRARPTGDATSRRSEPRDPSLVRGPEPIRGPVPHPPFDHQLNPHM